MYFMHRRVKPRFDGWDAVVRGSQLVWHLKGFADLIDEPSLNLGLLLWSGRQHPASLRHLLKLGLDGQPGSVGREGLQGEEILVAKAGHLERRRRRGFALRDIHRFLIRLHADPDRVAVAGQRFFCRFKDCCQRARQIRRLPTLVFHAQTLGGLCLRQRRTLDFSAQLLVLLHLRSQHGGHRSALRLRALSLLLGIPQFAIEEIYLLLHHLVAVLQRDQHRLLFRHLLAETFVFILERRLVRLAAGSRQCGCDQKDPPDKPQEAAWIGSLRNRSCHVRRLSWLEEFAVGF